MTQTRAQAAVGSLAWVLLLAVLTLAVGGLLYLTFDEVLQPFFERPEWRPETSQSSADASQVARGQRTLQTLWSVGLPLIVVAVGLSVLIRARRAGG